MENRFTSARDTGINQILLHPFTYDGGHISSARSDTLALPRTAVESEIDLPLFQAMLALPQWFA